VLVISFPVSGPADPGSPPPEVPEEFAAAYRAAYERALAAQSEGPQHREDPEPEWEADDDEAEVRLPERHGELRVGTHRTEDDEYAPTWFERVRDSSWFVPLLLALLAMLLILGAYAVGRRFAGQVDAGRSSAEEPSVVIKGGGSDGAKQPVTNQKPGKDAWEGKVERIGNVKATAGCTSKSSVDASGNEVAYDAGNLTDGAADTTWRCDGKAIGKQITLKLGKDLPIGQVGMVPGYAKTDDVSGEDRYAENNRVTRVRWTIGDIEIVQTMNGAPDDRSLQLIRVPKSTTDTVELEILAVKRGPRNTTAISEIQLGKAG
jgi:hypothetical protein